MVMSAFAVPPIPDAAMEHLRYHPVCYPSDSESVFDRLRGLERPQWLDSGYPDAATGRFDIFVAEPTEVLVTRQGRTTVTRSDGSCFTSSEDPFLVLQRRLAARPMPQARGPFGAGAVGYFGYELGYACVDLPRPVGRAESGVPDMVFGLHDWALVVDHYATTAWLARLPGARMTPERLDALLGDAAVPAQPFLMTVPESEPDIDSYAAAFERVSRYIQNGDCYQVNLARAMTATYSGDPWNAYRRLRALSPSPHGACLLHPEVAVLSISPERFLSLKDGQVETRPIKGTRPRGQTPDADFTLRESLRHSPKDLAENVMIVDLLRNDLGRICCTGTVNVPELFRIESHATVHHLVSTVTGTLVSGADACDLLRSCFPGGSITGAPKRRSMEIIAELERRDRGPYCGSLAYIGYDGSMDSSIAIRTAVCQDGRIRYWAGGGLVAESRVDEEFQETADKARAFLALADRR